MQAPPDYARILRVAPREIVDHARDYMLAGHVMVRPARSVITGRAGPQHVAAYIVAPENVAAWTCECGAVGSVDRPEHGEPCEHVVALVLAWLADEDTAVAVPRPSR
jgi:hypothetical protein